VTGVESRVGGTQPRKREVVCFYSEQRVTAIAGKHHRRFYGLREVWNR